MNYSTVVFVGDHPLVVACAGRARDVGLNVVGVSTDDASIKEWAADESIECLAWSGLADYLETTRPDVLLSVGNLRIIPDEMIASVGVTINFHDGPLPAYSGLHTPMWALLDSITEYSVSWHVVENGIDEGDVLASASFSVATDETTRSMNMKCFGAAGDAFEDLVAQLSQGQLRRVAQDGTGRYFGRYDRPLPGGALIPHTMSAADIDRYVRALDFGPTINRVGRALLQLDTDNVMVVKGTTQITLSGGAVAPGTVHSASSSGSEVKLTVETTTGPIELTGWAGSRVDLSGLAGHVLVDPSRSMSEVEKLHDASVRSEIWWSHRLANMRPADLAHLGEPVEEATADCQVGFESFDEAAAVAAAFVLSHTGQTLATVGVRSSSSVEGEGSPWFASLLPVNAAADFSKPAVEAVEAIRVDIGEALGRGPFLRDVSIRMPLQVDGPLQYQDPQVAIVGEGVQTRAPLQIEITNEGGGFTVRTLAISGSAAARIADGLESFSAAYCAAPNRALFDLPVLGNDETEALLSRGGRPAEHPFGGPLHEQFVSAASSRPTATALVHRGREVTYAELEQRSRRLATALERAGVTPGSFVGVSTAPGIDMAVGILGALMAGAAYVPLDPRFPAERLEFMVSDAEMALILTDAGSSASTFGPEVLEIGPTSVDATIPLRNVLPPIAESDLAYMMYTSGSTGLPKGVMVTHGNVDGFLRAMQPHLGSDPGVWLSVTTLSFDISVLELFQPLTNGWKVVLYEGLAAARSGPLAEAPRSSSRLDMSLFFFGSEEAGSYDLLLDAARFADRHGFGAVWTPERHFNDFGGPFPNPAVTGAAVAAVTENVAIRSGSCVLPLHHPVRAAEEWSVVDQLSRGRVGLSIAAGWHPEDFVLRPQNYGQSKDALLEQIDELRRMWRGEAVTYDGPKGPVDVLPLPRPVQPELPIWYTTAGNVESFELAGANGFNLLTHLLGQSIEDLEQKIVAYRAAWSAAGHPGTGTVSLMLHTFVTSDDDVVRDTVKEPMKAYLRDSIALVKEHASAFPTFDPTKTEADGALAGLTPEDMDALLEVSFARYFETSGLFGDVSRAVEFAEGIAEVGVDEIACLIDFGVPGDEVLDNLQYLDVVREAFVDQSGETAAPETYGSLIARDGVTHLQCTPSEARLVLADPQSRSALATLDKMLVGGEACPISVANDLFDAVGGDLINVYGPTETTIWSTSHQVTRDDLDSGAIPIGRPLSNTAVRVVAETGQLRPAGAIGELLIGGEGVTAGYHDRPELTSDRFVERIDTPGMVYRTGDLVSWRPDGRLAFHGRADSQVKIRGHRIE
ncbi:MAG: MupA/Atu3671 family FMN-dependent luciferase-like monooxygenase, partial [Acidimicrobiales bacterium]